MQSDDLAAALKLSSQAGWNQTLEDWELIFNQARENSWVAIEGNKIIGTVTSIKHSQLFDWVGMMVIDPGYRRLGIGRRLMQNVINGSTTGLVRLDASGMGAKLYEKLGFVSENKVTRFKSHQSAKHLKDSTNKIRTIESQDLSDIYPFDLKRTRYDRSMFLRSTHARGQGWLYRSGSELQGFIMARLGREDTQIGPIVAESREIAESLLVHALENHTHRPIVVDVFLHSQEWLAILKEYGFEAERSFDRMRLGKKEKPISTQGQFAILDPAMG